MMSVNFFQADCQTTTWAQKFGLHDPGNDAPAVVLLDREPIWHATVINAHGKKFSVRPLTIALIFAMKTAIWTGVATSCFATTVRPCLRLIAD